MHQAGGCNMHRHPPQSKESALNTFPWVGMAAVGIRSGRGICRTEGGRWKETEEEKNTLVVPFFPLNFPGPMKGTVPRSLALLVLSSLKRHLERDAVGW